MSASNANSMSGPSPNRAWPPTGPEEVANSGRVWSAVMMVIGFSLGALHVTHDSGVSWIIK